MTASALRNSASAEGRTKEPTESPVPEQKQDAGVRGKADANAPAPLRGMKRSLVIIAVLVVAAGAGGLAWWWLDHRSSAPTELVLYGNIDLRQVALPFNNNVRLYKIDHLSVPSR